MAEIAVIIRLLNNRSGGAERLYCELANKLAQHGHQVSCLIYESNYKQAFYRMDSKVHVVNLFVPFKNRSFLTKFSQKLVPARYKKKNFLFSPFDFIGAELDFILQLKRFFKGRKPDIAISFLPSANTPVLVATRGTDVRTICTNHNVPQQDYGNPERWSQNPLDRYLRRVLIKKADIIHVLFDEFGNWFGDSVKHKVRTIENYVPDDFFLKDEVKQKSNLIVGIGRLAPVKNYGVLIHAWAKIHKKHPSWSVEIYGTGPLRKQLESEIKELGLSKSFILKGHVEDVKGVYDRAKVFCHPAKYEGFGLSVAESLARGVPVVAFQDCDGVNQYVKDGFNGLMLSRQSGEEEVENLAEGLSTLIEDDEIRETLANKASDSVKEFSETLYYQKWERLIAELDQLQKV